MLGDTLRGGPCLGIKIPIHEQLAEAEQRKRNVPPYRPAFLEFQNRRQFPEITLGRVVISQERHFKPEIAAHLFYKREIRLYVFARVFEDCFYGLPPVSYTHLRAHETR